MSHLSPLSRSFAALALVLLGACSSESSDTTAGSGEGSGPTYYAAIKPIVDAHCIACHVEGGSGPSRSSQRRRLPRGQARSPPPRPRESCLPTPQLRPFAPTSTTSASQTSRSPPSRPGLLPAPPSARPRRRAPRWRSTSASSKTPMSRSAWQPPSRRPSGPTTTAASRSPGLTTPTSSSPASMSERATCRWFTTLCSTS